MTTGLASGIANSILDAYARSVAWTEPAELWVKLHTGDPGSAGTSNAASNTTRQEGTFSAAAGGSITTSAACTWTSVSATETYCCPYGQVVYSNDGAKPIGEIVPGDEVWTWLNGQLELRPVVAHMRTGTAPVFTIRTKQHLFQATDRHPVLMPNGIWKPVGELTTQDRVLAPIDLKRAAGASHFDILSIEKSDSAVPVYDIEVEGGHSFLADGVLVHNSHVSFWDASTAGTFIGSDALNAARGVTAGDTFEIPAGDLDLSLTPIAA